MAAWVMLPGGALLKRGTVPRTFVVSHFQGTNTVQYSVDGWLKACRENPVSRCATTVLQESKWYACEFITLRAKHSGAVYCNRSCLWVCV